MSSLQWIDLFGDAFDNGAWRLVAAIRRILGPASARTGPRNRDEDLRAHGRTAGPGQAGGIALTGARARTIRPLAGFSPGAGATPPTASKLRR